MTNEEATDEGIDDSTWPFWIGVIIGILGTAFVATVFILLLTLNTNGPASSGHYIR